MTANAISFQNLLIGRRCQPLGCGFQNFLDVSRHIDNRADQFGLRDQVTDAIRLVNLHQRDVEISVSDEHVSDGLEVDQRNVESFDDSFLAHNVAPQPKAANLDHFQNRTDGKENRRGIACSDFNSKAANGRGIPLAALGIATGASRNLIQRRPRKNHLAAKYIATSAMTDAPAIQHHIENSFAFSPRAIRSDSQSLRFAAATVRATSSSTRRTPASVPGRVRLVDQL